LRAYRQWARREQAPKRKGRKMRTKLVQFKTRAIAARITGKRLTLMLRRGKLCSHKHTDRAARVSVSL